MTNLTPLVLCCLALLGIVRCQVPSVYYFCTDNTNEWNMEFFVRENTVDVTLVEASDADTNSSMGFACNSQPPITVVPINPRQEITGDGTDANPFYLNVAINPQTQLPDPQCGAKQLSVTSFQFLLQTFSTPTGSYDEQNQITCDFSDITTTQSPTIAGQVTVTQQLVSITILSDPYQYEWLNTSLQPVTIVQSNTVVFRATFLSGEGVYSPIINASGISPHSCKICDVSDCTGKYSTPIIDSNGCPVGDYFSGDAFTGDGVTLVTSQAFLPDLDLHNTSFLLCSNDYCNANTGMAKCENRCNALNGRKRRDLREQNSENAERLDRMSMYDTQFYRGKRACFGRYATLVSILITVVILSTLVSGVQCYYLFTHKSTNDKSSKQLFHIIRK